MIRTIRNLSFLFFGVVLAMSTQLKASATPPEDPRCSYIYCIQGCQNHPNVSGHCDCLVLDGIYEGSHNAQCDTACKSEVEPHLLHGATEGTPQPFACGSAPSIVLQCKCWNNLEDE